MRIAPFDHHDLRTVLDDLEAFWGTDRTRHLHHPLFVTELGDTAAKVVDDDGTIGAYLLGFRSQTADVGYVHLVAVRRSWRGRGVARDLYAWFSEQMRERGCTHLKAITTPANAASIAFHEAMGFTTTHVSDHAGRGEDRIVMHLDLASPGR